MEGLKESRVGLPKYHNGFEVKCLVTTASRHYLQKIVKITLHFCANIVELKQIKGLNRK